MGTVKHNYAMLPVRNKGPAVDLGSPSDVADMLLWTNGPWMLHGTSTDWLQLMIAHAPLVSRASALGYRKQDSHDRKTKDLGLILSLHDLHIVVHIHPLRIRDARNDKNHIDNLFCGHSGILIACANRNTTKCLTLSSQVPSNWSTRQYRDFRM